jgi:hypothetical protein
MIQFSRNLMGGILGREKGRESEPKRKEKRNFE